MAGVSALKRARKESNLNLILQGGRMFCGTIDWAATWAGVQTAVLVVGLGIAYLQWRGFLDNNRILLTNELLKEISDLLNIETKHKDEYPYRFMNYCERCYSYYLKESIDRKLFIEQNDYMLISNVISLWPFIMKQPWIYSQPTIQLAEIAQKHYRERPDTDTSPELRIFDFNLAVRVTAETPAT